MTAEVLHFYEYAGTAPLRCPHCGWNGRNRDAFNEMFREVTDFCCPQCQRMLLVVIHPTIASMREFAVKGNAQAIRDLADFESRSVHDEGSA